MKVLVIFISVFFTACIKKNLPEISTKFSYRIEFLSKESRVYLNVDDGNDTIYLFNYKSNEIKSTQITIEDKATVEKIKKIVLQCIDYKNIFNERLPVVHGKMIVICLSNSNNSISTKFEKLGSYRDVSIEFSDFFEDLLKDNSQYKSAFVGW